MNQTKAVLNWLMTGESISSMEAFAELGVTRLSAKIFNLRKRGYNIVSEQAYTINRYGSTVRFVRYRLEEDDESDD